METPTRTQELLKLADACVVCGLCVPACPTYRQTGSEADSPRGRIQLMRAVLRDELEPSPRFHEHIDRCLTCRSCEAVCPNHVRYGDLVDGVRARYPQTERAPRAYDKPLSWLAEHPAGWSFLRLAAAPLQRLGLKPWLRRFGLGRLPAFGLRAEYAAFGAEKGRVGLFVGCVSRLADMPVLLACVHLLRTAGYRVIAPRAQACCGALAEHQGDADGAGRLRSRNREAFAGLDAVVFSASGCGATLLDAERRESQHAAAPIPVMDVLSFLDRLPPDALRFSPLAETVHLQTPCSQRNVVKSVTATERLLRRIPELRLQYLPGNDQCCGAAGRYHLDQPLMAEALRADKLAAIENAGARTVLTSNVGCALWLRAGDPQLRLLHPVELLAQQLEN